MEGGLDKFLVQEAGLNLDGAAKRNSVSWVSDSLPSSLLFILPQILLQIVAWAAKSH